MQAGATAARLPARCLREIDGSVPLHATLDLDCQPSASIFVVISVDSGDSRCKPAQPACCNDWPPLTSTESVAYLVSSQRFTVHALNCHGGHPYMPSAGVQHVLLGVELQ